MSKSKRKLAEAYRQLDRSQPIRLQMVRSLAVGEGELDVDVEAGVIRNASVITTGEAVGHPFTVDDITLDQVVTGINATARGPKSRMTHPDGSFWGGATDGIEVTVGRLNNARRDGEQVRGDLTFGPYAKLSPSGDLQSYLLSIAENDPEIAGLSIVFEPDWELMDQIAEEQNMLYPPTRLKDNLILAVDFVGDPGANPHGLLSAKPFRTQTHGLRGVIAMDDVLRNYLISIGLPDQATDEEAADFMAGLEGNEKAVAEKLSPPPAPEPEPEPAAEPEAETKSEPAAEPSESTGDGDAEIKAKAEGATLERQRQNGIRRLAADYHFDLERWAKPLIDDGVSLATAKERALKKLAEDLKPQGLADGRVEVGEDRNRSTLGAAVVDAIMLRARVPMIEIDGFTNEASRDDRGRLAARKPHDRAREFRGLSFVEMGRKWMASLGLPGIDSLSRSEIVDCMINPKQLERRFGSVALAMSTSDFPYLLENVMSKSLRAAYEDQRRSWTVWARQATAPDFKDIKRVALSEVPGLTSRDEGGEIQYVTLSESRETYALVEYTGGVKVTRKMIINDDMDAFARLPRLQAQAAARKEDDVCYAILTANAALSDSVALFDASTHANYVASGSGAAPSATTLNAGYAAMATQTGPKGEAHLNIEPRYILSPQALRGTVLTLLNSSVVPDAYGAAMNIWQDGLVPVFESRLDANLSTGWYLAGSTDQIDTIEVCFLEDELTPVLKQETEFGTDDVKYAVRHTVASKAIDYRGLYYNYGA